MQHTSKIRTGGLKNASYQSLGASYGSKADNFDLNDVLDDAQRTDVQVDSAGPGSVIFF